jgi:gliding motility-associated-like protein
MNRLLLVFFTLIFNGVPLYAKHIMGGNLEMNALDAIPGRYRVVLVLYSDQAGNANVLDDVVTVSIFARGSNDRMIDLKVPLVSREELAYTNPTCAIFRSLKTAVLRYELIITLDPVLYDSPRGYYMIHERCCRNQLVENIKEPGKAGMVFHLEFPPLLNRGRLFLNSSPKFDNVNGEYVCMNDPFSFDFKATDADGDELRYSLVTPYKGFSSEDVPILLNASGSTYPTVDWKSGFSASNQIPGRPALSIQRTTGGLTLTANSLGLFVFSVLCEEFRNGEKIGSVRRDFQLLVVDCPTEQPADNTIAISGQPNIQSIVFCEGGLVNLAVVNPSSNLNYQWRRDGANIQRATNTTLPVRESGNYTLVATEKNACIRSTTPSNVISVRVTPNVIKLISSSVPQSCDDIALTLSIATDIPSGYSFEWYKNGQIVSSGSQSTFSVSEAGNYSVKAKDSFTGCVATSNVIAVTQNQSPPKPNIKSQNNVSTICDGETIPLTINDNGINGLKVRWYLDGIGIDNATQKTYNATQKGQYVGIVYNEKFCASETAPFDLALGKTPVAAIDALLPVCGTEGGLITLKGSPTRGIFSGRSVVGNTFNPMVAGVGKFELSYYVPRQGNDCASKPVQATIEVLEVPILKLESETKLYVGSAVSLRGYAANITKYEWSPSVGLNRTDIAAPLASPEVTTTYTLKATATNGCVISGKTKVNVIDRLLIPDVFTPNGDGINDSLTILGTDKFPNLEVSIFNRWGNLIFYSVGYAKPFDGTYLGQPLPAGNYIYKINTNDGTQLGAILIER